MEMENKKLRDVAEIARQIMVGEELKGGQKKLDKNHNNKIDAQDLAIVRAQKEEVEAVAEAAGKPDFLDMDKDGNKTEPMKKAISDKKMKEETEKEDLVLEYESKDGKFVHRADRKSTRLNSSHIPLSRMPSSA